MSTLATNFRDSFLQLTLLDWGVVAFVVLVVFGWKHLSWLRQKLFKK